MEQPYIIKQETVETKHYNPNYGDDKFCRCGCTYHRHFDTYDGMKPVGCKYCGDCDEFKEERRANS